MWFWLIALIDYVVLLVLPHFWLGVPWWLHLPVVAVFWWWVPKESRWFRSLNFWTTVFDYEFVGEALPSKDETCLIAMHPHGVFTATTIMAFALNKATLHIKPAASSILFMLPILKEFAGLGGAFPANKRDIIEQLIARKSVVICPGGIRELPGLDPDRIKKGDGFVQRKGFIEIAQHVEVPVVPVWAEGEESLYDVWLWNPQKQQQWLSRFYYPGIVFSWGLWWLPFWPKSKKVTLHVGKAIYPKELTQEKFYNEMAKLKVN